MRRWEHTAVNPEPGLPAGWTVERLRAVSGDRAAVPISPDRPVSVVVGPPDSEPTALRPDLVLAFGGLCLVREDDEWYMGSLNDDGSVICWAGYGDNLEEALRGL